jgi:hypothetical protein
MELAGTSWGENYEWWQQLEEVFSLYKLFQEHKQMYLGGVTTAVCKARRARTFKTIY